MRLEAQTDQASAKVVVVGERNELASLGCIPAEATIIITGVPRARHDGQPGIGGIINR